MTNKSNSSFWVVVKVHSGIPVCAEIFKDESKARELENQLRSYINPEYDEVGVFCSGVK
jgi:hypothetical protein